LLIKEINVLKKLNSLLKKIKIKQIRSTIGCIPKHKDTILGLGLRGIGCVVIRENTPSIQGMLNKIRYLIKTEIID